MITTLAVGHKLEISVNGEHRGTIIRYDDLLGSPLISFQRGFDGVCQSVTLTQVEKFLANIESDETVKIEISPYEG